MKKNKEKKVKIVKSESELVKEQAARMLKDMDRLQATQKGGVDSKEKVTAVDIWKDSDFYFSVVFQTAKQKY